jgi:hypothetical protein
VRTTAGYSNMEGLNMCEQPPGIHTFGPGRPCANNRRFLANARGPRGHVRTAACYSHMEGSEGAGYTHMQGSDPGGHVRTATGYLHTPFHVQLGLRTARGHVRTTVGKEGAMCEQPPVIGTWNGVSCIVPLVLRTARGQVRTTAGYSNMSGRAQGAMCEQQAVIRICKDNHVLFIGKRSNPSEQPQVIRA